MEHPFITYEPEYDRLLATMQITRLGGAAEVAKSIIRFIDTQYMPVQEATSIPAAWVGAINYRESDQDFHTGLGQGDPINRPSVHVPRHEGPFASWYKAAIFYLNYDHIGALFKGKDWSMAYACYEGEAWNGFGNRAHGIHSNYLWAGTNHYVAGGYPSDGVYSSKYVDHRFGIVPLVTLIGAMRPELKIGGAPVVPLPAFVDEPTTVQIQTMLNKLGAELVVDGNYGRKTRTAVVNFQESHGLDADGIAGPLTVVAMQTAVGVGNDNKNSAPVVVAGKLGDVQA